MTGGFRSAILLAVAAVLAPGLALAQQPWQKLQMPTAAQVAARWKAPPAAYGPEPYYGLNGNMSVAAMDRDLDTMRSLGFRAVTAQAGRGMPYPYLSDAYFKYFHTFVDQAKKRGMKVWIVDDIGYPSGFAGGKFTTLKPELRMQALEAVERIPVAGGATVDRAVSPETVSAGAVSSDGRTEPIPIENDKIDWSAPSGNWTVIIVNHEFRTSPTRSDTNPTGKKDDSQSLEDYLNPAATRQFIAFTHAQYKRTMGKEFGQTIMGFRGDEPDYSIRGLPWTNAFFDRFKQIKGYDVRPYLAGFFVPNMSEEEQRVRADYWDVFSQMFSAGYFQVLGDWCAANHLEYQVHLNHEEAELQLAHSEGGFFRAMRGVQVPGIDTIWHQIWTDTISDFPRLASSEAHVYGKPRAFTESFAAYRPPPDVKQARYILNEEFVRGVNLIEVMYFPSTAAGPRPLRSFMGQPGFADLMHYTQRMSYLMAMGRPAASVALFLPTSSLWMNDVAANRDFVSTERLLSEHQIDFDIVSEDALARDLTLDKGRFTTLSGNSYRTVILPGEDLLSQQALSRLRAFARAGGRVLFLGKTPSLIVGRTVRDARPATPTDFSWAAVETSAQLSATPTPGQYPPAASPAPQDAPAAIVDAVDRAIPLRGVTLNTPDTALRYMHRRLKDASVYLFFNESALPISHQAALNARGTRAQVWDPETGAIKPLPSARSRQSIEITLALQPYQTRVVVVR